MLPAEQGEMGYNAAMVQVSSAPPPGRFARWLLPTTADVLFAGLLLVMVFGTPKKYFIRDGDTGWHIRAGDYMIDSRTVPRTDIFSHSRPGAPWVAYEWGTEVAFAAIHRWGGLNGVTLFVMLAIAAGYALLYHWLRRDGHSFVLAMPLMLFVVAGSGFHWATRPHPISYLFVIAYCRILRHSADTALSSRRIWALAGLMLVWVNLHAGFLAGLVILCGLTASALARLAVAPIERRQELRPAARGLALATLLATLATLCNPNFYRLYVYLVHYFHTVHLVNPDNELHSPTFQVTLFQPFLLALLMQPFLYVFSKYRPRLDEIVTLTIWSGLGLMAARNIPVMLFVGAPIYARLLSGCREPMTAWLARAKRLYAVLRQIGGRIERVVSVENHLQGHLVPATLFLLLVICVTRGGALGGVRLMDFKFPEREFPAGAIAYLRDHPPVGNVFNEWGYGGFLIYHFYPQMKVFVDGRMDLYGTEFTLQYIDLVSTPFFINGHESWKEVFDRYRIRWAMIPTKMPLRLALDCDPGWQLAYKDDLCVIFIRR